MRRVRGIAWSDDVLHGIGQCVRWSRGLPSWRAPQPGDPRQLQEGCLPPASLITQHPACASNDWVSVSNDPPSPPAGQSPTLILLPQRVANVFLYVFLPGRPCPRPLPTPSPYRWTRSEKALLRTSLLCSRRALPCRGARWFVQWSSNVALPQKEKKWKKNPMKI